MLLTSALVADHAAEGPRPIVAAIAQVTEAFPAQLHVILLRRVVALLAPVGQSSWGRRCKLCRALTWISSCAVEWLRSRCISTWLGATCFWDFHGSICVRLSNYRVQNCLVLYFWDTFQRFHLVVAGLRRFRVIFGGDVWIVMRIDRRP